MSIVPTQSWNRDSSGCESLTPTVMIVDGWNWQVHQIATSSKWSPHNFTLYVFDDVP